MRLLLAIAWVVMQAAVALGQGAQATPTPATEVVSGYTRSDGKVVGSYVRTKADGDFSNNFSTKGNVNPETGKIGTKTEPPMRRGKASDADSERAQGVAGEKPQFLSMANTTPPQADSGRRGSTGNGALFVTVPDAAPGRGDSGGHGVVHVAATPKARARALPTPVVPAEWAPSVRCDARVGQRTDLQGAGLVRAVTVGDGTARVELENGGTSAARAVFEIRFLDRQGKVLGKMAERGSGTTLAAGGKRVVTTRLDTAGAEVVRVEAMIGGVTK